MFGLSALGIKAIIIGLLIAAALAYVGFLHIEINHYKSDRDKIQKEFTTYRINEESMQAALKSSNSALTLEAKQQLIARLSADALKNAAIKERIMNDQAAKSIAIPADSIRVLNDSASIGRDPTRATPTIGADDGTTSGTSSDPQTGFTLQDVEGTVAENNAAAWVCVQTLREWQKFWTDFSANVGRVAAHGSP